MLKVSSLRGGGRVAGGARGRLSEGRPGTRERRVSSHSGVFLMLACGGVPTAAKAAVSRVGVIPQRGGYAREVGRQGRVRGSTRPSAAYHRVATRHGRGVRSRLKGVERRGRAS